MVIDMRGVSLWLTNPKSICESRMWLLRELCLAALPKLSDS